MKVFLSVVSLVCFASANINTSVNALVAEREPESPESELLCRYTDTCPTAVWHTKSLPATLYVESQRCHLVHPEQRITYIECNTGSCYGSFTNNTECVSTLWIKKQFLVWCPNLVEFKQITRQSPQACSCYKWKPCSLQANE